MMLRTLLPLIAAAAPPQEEGGFDIQEMIRHHLSDSHEWETPFGVVHFPHWTLHFGNVTLDVSMTKHVFFMLVAAVIVAVILIPAARRARREHEAGAKRGPRGAANVVEAFVLFLRDEVALSTIGPGGERFVPYIIAVFFFVLVCNLMGLLPWGATPTGNVSVTAALAALSFILIETAGIQDLGAKGYARTIFYAPEGLSTLGRIPIIIIMAPVEFLGKLTKPFALAIRLYANMTAGHAVILALTGLLVMAANANALFAAPAPVIMAVAIMLLEIFIAFLQAYIFAILSAVFIGLIRHAH